MSVYKIFPKKDTTIFEHQPDLNFSLNEILYLQDGNSSISRILIQFNQDDINNILTLISSSNYTCSLKLFSAETYGLYNDTNIDVFLLAENFTQGYGKITSNPVVNVPVNWKYPVSESIEWLPSSSNIQTSFYNISGGGSWFINNSASTTLSYNQNPDLNIDITTLISESVSLNTNNGLIIKINDDVNNFNNPILKSLSYFSCDTSTIYSPQLEFKWNDSVISSSYPVIDNKDISIYVDLNNEYYNDEIVNIDIYTSLRYPIKTYQTSSAYLNYYLLPIESCYGIKDTTNDLMVIDFDFNNTKLSAINEKNYFTLYINGLEPERYYEVLIKYKFNGQTYISNNKNYFKIIKNSYEN